jgi:hypothetical protein
MYFERAAGRPGSAVVLQKRFSHEPMSANFKRGAALV